MLPVSLDHDKDFRLVICRDFHVALLLLGYKVDSKLELVVNLDTLGIIVDDKELIELVVMDVMLRQCLVGVIKDKYG